MHKIDALTDSQSVGALPFRGRAVVFAVLSVPESTGIIVPACMAGSMRQCLCTAHLNPRLYGTIDARPNGAFPRPVAALHKRIGPQPSVRQRFCTISRERCGTARRRNAKIRQNRHNGRAFCCACCPAHRIHRTDIMTTGTPNHSGGLPHSTKEGEGSC